jgi:chemotaxis protein CheY-P-specific phosphatase CheC
MGQLHQLTDIQLAEVVARMLEEAAFIFAEPATGVSLPEELVTSELSFDGPMSGLLLLAGTPDLAIELAANMLGLEANDAETQQRSEDAIGEMLNIISGALLEGWFGSEAVCVLGSPSVARVFRADYLKRIENAQRVAALVSDDEHRIDLSIFYQP